MTFGPQCVTARRPAAKPPAISPTHWVDDTLVIVDGPSRLRWQRSGHSTWRLAGVWPDVDQLASVRSHVKDGGRLLVVLGANTPVLAWRSEVPRATSGCRSRRLGEDLVELRIAPLDWLFPHLRERGLTFANEARHRQRETPSALCPSLILEDTQTYASVRFAWIAKPTLFHPYDWRDVVGAAFAGSAPPSIMPTGRWANDIEIGPNDHFGS